MFEKRKRVKEKEKEKKLRQRKKKKKVNIYGRILNERMMKITDKSVGDEQGGFLKGRGCIDQIFCSENIGGKNT